MKKITTWLWFDDTAQAAADYYVSVFPNSRITNTVKYLADTPSNKPIGSVMSVYFELDGTSFAALNGGPYFKINEAISFQIACTDQAEMDYYYDKLSAVPEAEQCGWIKDQFGVSWQIVPENMEELMSHPDPDIAKKKMEAMMEMKRIDVEALKQIG